MKKLKYIFSLFLVLSLVSCFEIEEKTVFDGEESGQYTLTMDMSGMIDQMKMIPGLKPATSLLDSIVYFKNSVDADTALTTEQKNAIREGFIQNVYNEKKGEAKIILGAPFKNVTQLLLLKDALLSASNGLKKSPLIPGDLPGGASLPFSEMTNINSGGTFTYNVSKGSITNQLADADALKEALKRDSTSTDLMAMLPMFGSAVTFKNVYTFLSPVKSYKAANAFVSEDKKTITFTNTLSTIIGDPKSLEFSISY